MCRERIRTNQKVTCACKDQGTRKHFHNIQSVASAIPVV